MLLKNKRVFIIEDNLENRAIIQLLVEQNGARTAIERWGTDVLKRLKAFMPVDIILLDLMFPNNISGYDIFDQIRSVAEFTNIPIVAVSAADPYREMNIAKNKGFAGFISKPLDYDLFARQLAAILNGEQVWNRLPK